jgi:hypothetical protein
MDDSDGLDKEWEIVTDVEKWRDENLQVEVERVLV